jgi:hypothetical protein
MRTKKQEWIKLGIVMFLWVSIPIIGLNMLKEDGTMVTRRRLQENFNDHTVVNTVVTSVDWTALPGDDEDGSTIRSYIQTKNGSNWLKLLDSNNGNNVEVKYTFRILMARTGAGTFTFKIFPETSTANFPFVYLQYWEGADTGATRRIYIRFDLSNGSVSSFNGSTFIDSNLDLTLDTINDFEIIKTSASTHKVKVGDSISAELDNNSTITSAIDRVHVITQENNDATITCWFDDFIIKETSKGMQWRSWMQNGNDITAIEPTFAADLHVETSTSVLFPDASFNLIRTTLANPDNWSQALAAPTNIWLIQQAGDGTVYVGDFGEPLTTAGDFKKSIDHGATWNNGGSVNLHADLNLYILFEIDDVLHAVFLDVDGGAVDNDYLRVYSYDGTSDWTLEASYDLGAIGLISVGTQWGHSDDTNNEFHFYFSHIDAGTWTLKYFKFDKGGSTITLTSTTSGYRVLSGASIYDDTTRIASVIKQSDSLPYLLKSTNSGTSFSELLQQNMALSKDDEVDQWKWGYDRSGIIADTEIYVYETYTGAFRKVFDIKDNIPDAEEFCFITGSGNLVIRNVDDYGEFWEYTLTAATIIKDCTLYGYGNEQYRQAEWLIAPSNAGFFNKGDVVEFYDGYDVLAFKGKVIDSRFVRGKGQVITGLPLKAEVLEEPKDTSRSFTNQATDIIVETIVADMDFLYDDGNIDSNGDFTITYTINIKTPIMDYINTARHLERAVFFVTPGGEVQMYAHDQIPSTGLIWRDDTFKQIQLRENFTDDMRLTRSEVIGAYVLGAADNVEVRRDYIGDASKEASEGVVRISLSRPQLTNDTEVNQLAQNRFNIYGGETRFIKLFPVKNQGFIQPGKTIDFAWEETDTTVPQGDYFIARWIYNLKHDVYLEFWLTDNIVTEKEWAEVRATIGRDNQVTETYHEGENETSGDGTVVVQNPVSRLRAGTFVWRIPEPTACDFTIGTLPAFTATWSDLDLSSIVPDGARAVLLSILVQDNVAGSVVSFRKNGQTNIYQRACVYSIVANQLIGDNPIVGVDDSQVIEIYTDPAPASWTTIDLSVLGWWL